jgi:hypothetical protein
MIIWELEKEGRQEEGRDSLEVRKGRGRVRRV